jgi:hypothetical protein
MLAKLGAIGIAMLACAAHAAAAVCAARSPLHTVALVELYTSEGCESCVPADRWLASLSGSGLAPQRIVALALHLDARDYRKDDDAREALVAHRYKLARLRRPAIVYTPQLLLQGRDFPGWRTDAFAKTVAEINAQRPRASLEVAIRSIRAGAADIELDAELLERKATDAAVYVAAYEKREDHFVVQEWQGPIVFDQSGRLAQTRSVPLLPGAAPGRSGVVAFVQNRREVLQSLMLAGCP